MLFRFFNKNNLRGACGVALLSALSLAQTASVSNCTPEEGVFFSCRLKENNRLISICTAPKNPPFASITYRYATGTKVEVTYAASSENQNRFMGTVSAVSPRATVRQVWFELNGGKYIATSCVGGDCAYRGGLIVFRNGRLDLSQPCAEDADGHPWFASDVVRFRSTLEKSRSNTDLIQLLDVDNDINVLYSGRKVN